MILLLFLLLFPSVYLLCDVHNHDQDVITDLNAEGEPLPLNPPREDWLAHKVLYWKCSFNSYDDQIFLTEEPPGTSL